MSSSATAAKNRKNNIWHYIISAVVMLLVTALALYYVLYGNVSEVFAALEKAKAGYVFAMAMIIVISFTLEGTVLAILSKLYKKSYHIYQGVLCGLIGGFFSSVTPFSSGGQFVQAYTFSKQGIKPADSASILVMLFIVSQTVIVVYGTLAIIFGYQSTILKMNNLDIFGFSFSPIAFSAIGYVINIISLSFLFLLSYSRPIHRFILTTVIGIGAKLHIVKDPERRKTALATQVATFRIELKRLLSNFGILLITGLLEFAKFTCYNILPFFAGLALGADMHGMFWQSLWSNSYLSMITTFIPSPGASGGAEAGFQLLFLSVYKDAALTSAANLLARFVSFYFPLFIGFFVFVMYRGSPKKDIYSYDNRKTFVDLQIVSLTQAEDPQLREVTFAPFGEKDDEEEKTETKEQISPSADMPKRKHRIKLWNRKAKSDRKEDFLPFLSPEEISKSFKQIKQSLIMDQKDIYRENDEVTKNSRRNLRHVYDDVSKLSADKIKAEKTDTEIALAIKQDLQALKDEQERRQKRRKARRNRCIKESPDDSEEEKKK